MNEKYEEEFKGQHVCIRELLGDKFEWEHNHCIYKLRTDLRYNRLSEWIDRFDVYRYSDTVWNTAPLKEELVKHYQDFLNNFKKRSLDYQGRTGALEAKNITDLIWVLESMDGLGFDIDIDDYEGINGFTCLNIRVPRRTNEVLSRLEAYRHWGMPVWYEKIGGTIQTCFDKALLEMYDNPYIEHSINDILDMVAEECSGAY